MKNYFLLVSEDVMNHLKPMVPWMQFVEATGINVKEFPDHTFLTTPAAKKEESSKEEIVEINSDEGKQYQAE